MSRFKQVKHPSDPELKSLYKTAIEAGFVGSEEGIPNNLVTSLSERPDILAAILILVDKTILQGLLPRDRAVSTRSEWALILARYEGGEKFALAGAPFAT